MPYVQRDNGPIVGLYACEQPGYAEEFLADDHPEVLAFLNPPPTAADYSRALRIMLDAKAQERQYDGILTAVTYLDDPNPAYAAEAAALKAWRSAVWTYSLAALANVQAGTRDAPTVEDFLAEVTAACPFSWPE